MRTIILLLLFFKLTILSSQISGTIYQTGTTEFLPYVNIWIKGENKGTTSDTNGKFFLDCQADSALIVFSYIGYERKEILKKDLSKKIYLEEIATLLDAVVVRPAKSKQQQTLGKIEEYAITHSFYCGQTPWRVGKRVNYQESIAKTPYLKEVAIWTTSRIRNAKIRIDILVQSEDLEEPTSNKYVLAKGIYQTVKKGDRKTKIDLSDYQIKIPDAGIIVLIEWLIIPSNQFPIIIQTKEGVPKEKVITYAPEIGLVDSENGLNTLIYKEGEWSDINAASLFQSNDKNQVLEVAMEIKLTD